MDVDGDLDGGQQAQRTKSRASGAPIAQTKSKSNVKVSLIVIVQAEK